LHICFVDRSYPINGKPAGGSGRYISNIVKELKNRGNMITVIVSPNKHFTPSKSFNKSINIFPYYSNTQIIWYLSKIPLLNVISKALEYLLEGWYVFQTLNCLHQKNKFDIVEYTEGGDFWSSFFKRWPTIAHLHCSQYTVLDQCNKNIDVGVKLKRKLEHCFIKRSNRVIAPSKSMISIVEKEMGHHLKAKKVIPLPIDPAIQFTPKVKKTKQLIGIFASRLDPLKGGDILLKSILCLEKSDIEKVYFKFFGYFPDKKVHLKNIEFSSFIQRNELIIEIKKADFIIVPTLFDNSPNIIYEGMALGKLIIASDVGGIPELIHHGKTGLLFKKGDHYDLKKQLGEIIKNPDMVKKLSNNGRKFITSIANVEKNAVSRIDMFDSLIGNS
jgi:glycosyltransferase involved in cell wall biosynthesis